MGRKYIIGMKSLIKNFSAVGGLLCLLSMSNVSAANYPLTIRINDNLNDPSVTVDWTYGSGDLDRVQWVDPAPVSPFTDSEGTVGNPNFILYEGTFIAKTGHELSPVTQSYFVTFTEPGGEGGGVSDQIQVDFLATTWFNGQQDVAAQYVHISFASDPTMLLKIGSPVEIITPEVSGWMSISDLVPGNGGVVWPGVNSLGNPPPRAIDIQIASLPDSGDTLMLVVLGLLGIALLQPYFKR